QHLNTTKNFPPNLLKYAEQSGALNNLQIYIPIDLIPEDFSLKAGKTNLTGEEIQFLGKNYEIIFKTLSNQLTPGDLKKSSLSEEQVAEIVEKFEAIIKRSFGDGATVKYIRQTDENK